MADALALGASGETRESSTLSSDTRFAPSFDGAPYRMIGRALPGALTSHLYLSQFLALYLWDF